MNALWLGLIVVSVGAIAFEKDKIDIKFEKASCLDNRSSMDIEVKINDEKFRFSPSCSFTFSDRVKTKAGTECEVKSGMCSSFSGRERFEVKCKGMKEASVAIPCPAKK